MDGKAHIHDIQQRGEVSTFGCNGPKLSRKELQNERHANPPVVEPEATFVFSDPPRCLSNCGQSSSIAFRQNESCLVTILAKPDERSDVVVAALLTPFVCRIQTV